MEPILVIHIGSQSLYPRCIAKQEALELYWVPTSDDVNYEVASFHLNRNCSYSNIDKLLSNIESDRISATNYSNATFDYQLSSCYLFAVRTTKNNQIGSWESFICRAWLSEGTVNLSL